jgi:hypothetical protein
VNEQEVEIGAAATITDMAYTMTFDDFEKLKVAQRDVLLFALVRELAASQKVLEQKVLEFEQKARDLMSPEGIEEAKKKIFEAIGFGGDGGMFGGMFS